MAEICGPIVRLGKFVAHRSLIVRLSRRVRRTLVQVRCAVVCDPPSRPWCVVELGSATCMCARGLPLLPIKINFPTSTQAGALLRELFG